MYNILKTECFSDSQEKRDTSWEKREASQETFERYCMHGPHASNKVSLGAWLILQIKGTMISLPLTDCLEFRGSKVNMYVHFFLHTFLTLC